MALMFELNREAGTTLVLVTHDREIAARCDRQLRIDAGRIVESTPPRARRRLTGGVGGSTHRGRPRSRAHSDAGRASGSPPALRGLTA